MRQVQFSLRWILMTSLLLIPLSSFDIGIRDISSSQSMVAPGDLRICSFNIRYSNDQDGANNWEHRKVWVSDFIKFFDLDIVGMQEVQNDQKEDLSNLLSEYEAIGVSSDPGKANGTYEFCAIYYRPDRVKLLNSGNFWLSDTPNQASKGWDAIFQRIVTWGQFENASGESFFVFNTHFSHVGESARNNSARVMRQMMSEIAGDSPMIAMGDFNARPETQAIKTMTSADSNKIVLNDAQKSAESSYGPNFTFNCFGGCEIVDGNVIDFIFVTENVRVASHAVFTEQRGEVYISDHYPIMATISIQE